MKTGTDILVVDDEHDIRALLRDFLERRGFRVATAQNGEEMKSVLRQRPVDLIVLDVMMPGQSGLDLCRELRATSKTPVIMLTAAADTTDRILGLELGADDYLAKPFDPRELSARIKAVLRRHASGSEASSSRPAATRLYRFAGWVLDVERRRLMDPKGVRVELTTAEFHLLKGLAGSKQRVMTRDYILELSGAEWDSFDRSVDIMISRLRRKLGDNPRAPRIIQTVRGGGYQFVADTSEE
ncbi:response regulator [Rhizobium sp.]